MPLHLLHLLQLLNVACFLLLKRIYSNKSLALAHSCIYYINKVTFLLAFKAAFSKIFTIENIRAGFRGARLVLYNLKTVLLKLNIRLLKLNIRLRTLNLLKSSNIAQELKTPRNAYKVEGTKRKTCKQHYIRAGKTFTVSKVANLVIKKKIRGSSKGETLRRECVDNSAAGIIVRLDTALALARQRQKTQMIAIYLNSTIVLYKL